MPTFKDIRAKNANFAQAARDNAGKPRIRASQRPEAATSEGDESNGSMSKLEREKLARRARNNVKPAKRDRLEIKSKANLSRIALAVICFVVVGGVFFELLRAFL